MINDIEKSCNGNLYIASEERWGEMDLLINSSVCVMDIYYE